MVVVVVATRLFARGSFGGPYAILDGLLIVALVPQLALEACQTRITSGTGLVSMRAT